LIVLDLAGNTIEVEYPKLISYSIFQTRQQFKELVENLKKLSAEKFNSMIEYTENDIDNWLVEYGNRNKDIETTLENISIDYRE
jgi:rubrerythrin